MVSKDDLFTMSSCANLSIKISDYVLNVKVVLHEGSCNCTVQCSALQHADDDYFMKYSLILQRMGQWLIAHSSLFVGQDGKNACFQSSLLGTVLFVLSSSHQKRRGKHNRKGCFLWKVLKSLSRISLSRLWLNNGLIPTRAPPETTVKCSLHSLSGLKRLLYTFVSWGKTNGSVLFFQTPIY